MSLADNIIELRGKDTSEGKRNKVVLILGLIMSVMGMIATFVVDNYPLEGMALSVVSLLATVANQFGYSKDRANVKTIAMQVDALSLKKNSKVEG